MHSLKSHPPVALRFHSIFKLLETLVKVFTYSGMNVHAKFRHTDVFCEGCTNFVRTFVMGSV